VQQNYGDGAAAVVLGLNQVVASREATGLLVTPQGSQSIPKQGALKLRFGDTEFDTAYEGWSLPDRQVRATKFHIDASALAALRNARSIAIEADDGVSAALVPDQTSAAFAMLQTCGARLLQAVGVDPAAEAKAVTPAEKETPENWLSYDNYPPDALRRHEGGTTMMLWTIDLKGHVRDCRIIASSGSKSLDDAACKAITRNGRYKPALDAAGTPIVSHETQKVVWSMPR
jgi:TonB family protein